MLLHRVLESRAILHLANRCTNLCWDDSLVGNSCRVIYRTILVICRIRTKLSQNIRGSYDRRSEALIYMRMLIYELLALFPASVIVIPYETVRDRIQSSDVTLFTDGSGKRIALGCAPIGSCVRAPVCLCMFVCVSIDG